MSTLRDVETKPAGNRFLDCLTEARRRRILSVLLERSAWTAERELATRLVADEEGKPVEEVVSEEVRPVHVNLRHVHLPKLAECGLVRWDREGATVIAADRPLFDDQRFRQFVETEGKEWDEMVANVNDERRRVAITTLESWNGPLTIAGLARAVATHEADGDPSVDLIEEVRLDLFHVHLPKLEEAGLIEYDPDDGTIVQGNHPKLSRMESLGLVSL